MGSLRKYAVALFVSAVVPALAQPPGPLQIPARVGEVTISGVSSGGAMALQYAIAHSATISGVGVIAGPAWGCAQGRVSTAVNECMCDIHDAAPPESADRGIREIALMSSSRRIDPVDWSAARPAGRLERWYLFHSPADATVKSKAATINTALLTTLTGRADGGSADPGNAVDGSDQAGHGIIAPVDGAESCRFSGDEKTYVRRCGDEDNAGELLHALHAGQGPFDASRRDPSYSEARLKRFSQLPLIQSVRKDLDFFMLASDRPFAFSPRRDKLDLNDYGYYYVPPSCDSGECGLHVALHGCKQDIEVFARRSGYNNWADHYKVIVVYPAVKQTANPVAESCTADFKPIPPIVDFSYAAKSNPNGCWDWWGYLDNSLVPEGRYQSRSGPQILFLEKLIDAARTGGQAVLSSRGR